ncbi:MAG: amidohydrolase [Lachnospiraceae bacterium]|nr:amidohydrolase [Lachnospiraceae bacterium]
MAEIWIKNGYALIDGAVGRHDIYISGSLIAGIDAAPKGFQPEQTIDGTDRLVIPGLVNSHTHSYMAALRNIADDLPFMDWLLKGVQPVEDRMSGEDAYWGAMLAMAEMIRSGTTTFNDMQMHIHQTTRAAKEAGMRAVICRGLVGDKYDRDDVRIKEALEEMGDGKDCDRLTFLLGPHAPYSAGADYLRCVADLAKDKGMGIHIHLAESVAECENLKNEYGCTPIEYAEKAGCFDVPCIAAHCVQITDRDIEILKKHDVSVVTNPASNMKLGNGFAPVQKLLDAGVNVALGTDGAASNNSLNMFHEMNLLALIHKGTGRTPVSISAGETLKIATENGARAIGLSGITGRIAEGLKADLALLDITEPSMIPHNNLLSSLAYSANGSETDTVIIDGEIVMEGRQLKTIDMERVRFEIGKMCERLGIG